MKFTVLIGFMATFALANALGEKKAKCLIHNFDTILFTKKGQEFVYILLRLIKDHPTTTSYTLIQDIDKHGDKVLEDYYEMKKLDLIAAQMVYVTKIVDGSNTMVAMLQQLLPILPKDLPMKAHKAKSVIEAALDINKKAMKC